MRCLKRLYTEFHLNPRLFYAAFMALLPAILFALPVMAADDFSDMADNVEGQAQGLAGAAQMLFYLVGFVLVGLGLLMLAISRSKGVALAMMVIGFILTSIGVFISMGSGSFFGSDESGTDSLLE